MDIALAGVVLALHVAFILWVVFGAFLTRRRPVLAALHLASLIWGVLVEIEPWPCPLTLLEQHLEFAAGWRAYQGAFLVHYLRALVYPSINDAVLIAAAVLVASVNAAVYARRWARRRASRDCATRPA